MSTELIVYVLTGLAAVVILLTRLRLGNDEGGAGRADVGRATLNVHTVAGVLALAAWLVFLFGDDQLSGRPRRARGHHRHSHSGGSW